MAVGHTHFPELMYAIQGLKIGTAQAHVRYPNRRDMVVFECAVGSSVAGVFTQNDFAAAPVQVCREHLKQNTPRFLVINTGNANAATGQQGLENSRKTCEKLAQLAGVASQAILPFSTGVIGEQLPIERVLDGVALAYQNAQQDKDPHQAWHDAASGIMTTDTIAKGASERIEIDGIAYHITGISKGAGMIYPNMATMLAFVATDFPIEQGFLQHILQCVVAQSFNRITVDGDTSTNDSCILMATGQAGGAVLQSEDDPRFATFYQALQKVMLRLAELIVRDGEGATKFIRVHVEGGKNTDECCAVAYSIAHSPLIKTALFASDPNWGRIVMAIGKAGVTDLDSQKVNIWLGDVQICRQGGVADDYTEEAGAKVMVQAEIDIRVDLGRGDAKDTVYTCDLSYEYVKINADYRS